MRLVKVMSLLKECRSAVEIKEVFVFMSTFIY